MREKVQEKEEAEVVETCLFFFLRSKSPVVWGTWGPRRAVPEGKSDLSASMASQEPGACPSVGLYTETGPR